MSIVGEAYFIAIWVEGFLYGKMCSSSRIPAKEIQLFPGIGLYSGIFTMYLLQLECPSKKFRTTRTIIHFCAVSLLYVLSTATFVSDLVAVVLDVSNNSFCKNTTYLSVVQTRAGTLPPQLQTDSLPMMFRISIIQTTASGCCDFLAQCILVRMNHYTCHWHPFYWQKCSKIYRCWVVWGQDIPVVIIPSFLAIAYLGQSSYLHLISRFQVIASSYLASGSLVINICTRPIYCCSLGGHDGYDSSRRVYGCECPSDGLDRFQDPQGVLAS